VRCAGRADVWSCATSGQPARETGAAVSYVCEPGLIHGSYRMTAKIPAGKRLIARAVVALQDALYR